MRQHSCGSCQAHEEGDIHNACNGHPPQIRSGPTYEQRHCQYQQSPSTEQEEEGQGIQHSYKERPWDAKYSDFHFCPARSPVGHRIIKH